MRTLALVCLVAAPAGALEIVRRDVALAVEALPTAFDFTLETPTGTTSGSDEFDHAFGMRLGGRWSFAGPGDRGAWIAGVDLRLGDADYDGAGTYRTIGVGLSGGYAWRWSRRWTAYTEPVLEYGWASLDFDATAERGAISADGAHLLWGIRAGALYEFSPTWLLQADLGWTDIRSDTTSDGRSFDLEQQGLVIGLGVVYRLSAAPARLE